MAVNQQYTKQMINNNSGIEKTWVIKGKITNVSPLIMGAGEGEDVDKIIQRNYKGQPIINGSAFIGCLQNHILQNYKFDFQDQYSSEYFWGTDSHILNSRRRKNMTGLLSSQSHIRIYPIELYPEMRPEISILDGIKINNQKNIVEEKAKYDYEVINNKVSFYLRMEIIMRVGMCEEDFKSILSAFQDVFSNGNLRIGAYTSTGYGKISISDVIIRDFNFPVDSKEWFYYKQDAGNLSSGNFSANKITLKEQDAFSAEAIFRIKNSLITGGYNQKSESDKAQYNFDQRPALLGKAIKGAINHRMIKILNTLGIKDAEYLLIELIGWGAEEKKKFSQLQHDARASRMKIEFALIKKTKSMLQDRIKIDRFTQSTVDGAKYDSEPTWSQDNDDNVTITIKIEKYKKWEAALLLHVIKDLWCEDLAIGGEKNAGRGILIGKKAVISYNGKNVELINNKNNAEIKELNDWNNELLNLKN